MTVKKKKLFLKLTAMSFSHTLGIVSVLEHHIDDVCTGLGSDCFHN